MNRVRLTALVLVASLAASVPLSADIRTDERVRFQLGGAIGKLVNMFGGKGAREGVVSVVAVKGDRKATLSDTTGQIIDLAEEKIYDLDMKKKTYTVTTFAELRKQMEDARREAEKSAREERPAPGEPSKPAPKDPNEKEFEVDFDIRNTGVSKSINGFDTRQSVVTITVREKGKTLDQSGGLQMITDLWLAANAPSTKDVAEFDMRYAQKIYGPMVVGASARDMAMAMAMYPQMKPALDRMRAESGKIQGTPILTEMRMEAVPPGAANTTAAAPAPAEPARKGLGGMLGGLKKMAEAAQTQKPSDKAERAMILSTSVETLKLTTTVDAASVALPAGFTQSK
jgi:hypothetical protein